MVVIRLSRGGAKARPFYNIVAADKRCRRDGRTTCVYNIDVKDDLGRDIAQAVVTGFKL